jgi:prepilin-type N-terminal cleavage/methylation domain-containing protein
MIVHSDKYKRGFTLIELVIVVSVIAVLSGVSIFAMREARTSGRDAKRRADLAQIASSLELYKADCNFYPNTVPAVNAPLTGASSFGCTVATAATNIYIQAMPGDPDGSAYAYTVAPSGCSGNCTRFCIWANLEGDPTLPAFCNSTNCGSVPSGFDLCITNP